MAPAPNGALVLGPHMTGPFMPSLEVSLRAENERLRADIARMHDYILDSEMIKKAHWALASERGLEIQRLRRQAAAYESICRIVDETKKQDQR